MKRVSIILFFGLFTCNILFAQERNQKLQLNLKDGIALQGYDPVAYFTQNKALKGSKDQSLYHKGVTYHFSSSQNKEAFKSNASIYEPEYGGWCAYAMGLTGEKVMIDPVTFKIVNSKLYLFYNKFFNNTLKDWNKDEAKLKARADKHWLKIFQ